MARKKREKSITLPGLFWDGETWAPASAYPNYTIFTSRVLAEALMVSPMTISTWRKENVIPFTLSGSGSFAIYNLNEVIEALLKAGYSQDKNKRSEEII